MQDSDAPMKRQALKGQWETPPVMEKFSSSTQSALHTTPDPLNIPIPDSTADYAKALQDAYRRGAQAAARSFSSNLTAKKANGDVNAPVVSVPNPFDPNSVNAIVSNFIGSSPPTAAVQYPNATPSAITSNAGALEYQQSVSVHLPQRSMSMPDMSNSGKVSDEEAKRLKRLARNRASARLRRLRKKNLVESYESEVGVLESSLAKLKSHQWGIGTDPAALLEALSMDRGQQPINSEKRKEVITSILSQQKEQVENLIDCHLENMILGLIAQRGNTDANNIKTDEEFDSLANELEAVLELTPEQKDQLRIASEGADDEFKAIQSVNENLDALISNSWLMNSGIEEYTDQFLSNLNPTQISKFMLWTDYNSESIEQLGYVNAPPSTSLPSSNPIFTFGIDESNVNEE